MAKKKEVHTADIETKLKELREKMRVIKFSIAGSGSKNVKEEKNLRREIARLMTAQNAK